MKLGHKLIAIGLALIGIGVATRRPPKKQLVQETKLLIKEESARLGKPLNGTKLTSELNLLNREELMLFKEYVDAIIHRKEGAARKVATILRSVPTFRRPFWHDMKGIIF